MRMPLGVPGGMLRSARLIRLVAWAAGGILVVVLVWRIGWRSVAITLERVGPAILWLVASYAVGTAVMALPWRLFLPREVRPSLIGTVSSRFAATGLNAMLPLVSAGEASRLLWL